MSLSSDDSDAGPSGGGRLRRRPASFRPSSRRLGSSGSFGQSTIPEIPESSEVHSSAPSHELTRPQTSIATSSNSAELGGENVQSNDTKNMVLVGAMLTESPVSSPSTPDDLRPFSSSRDPPILRGTLSRSRAVKKSSLLSNVSSASDYSIIDEPSSPSRRRWDELRQHFLPQLLSTHAPDARSSFTPPPALQAPPRPSTPKQFRMPKLGFKQAVEQAQEASVDQMTRFADDILRTSRAVRSVESKAQRREREGTLTSFNMSFMSSNASLGLGMPSSYLPPSRAKPIQRPPSLQSTTVSHPPPVAPTSLYKIISYYASITTSQQRSTIVLPHENEVLLTLLLPFLSVRSENSLNEQLQSMEAFEIIVKTWRAPSELVAH
jgi:hypothetical protein